MYIEVRKETEYEMKRKVKNNCLINTFIVIVTSSAFLLLFTYANEISDHQNARFNIPNPKRRDTQGGAPTYTWRCELEKCSKSLSVEGDSLVSQDTCNMMCDLPPIWPKPRHISVSSKGSSTVNKQSILFDFTENEPARTMLQNATSIFMKYIECLPSNQSLSSETALKIKISLVSDNESKLKLTTNESYSLTIEKTSQEVVAVIQANNYFGARHGLETLSQLIWHDSVSNVLKILHDVQIEDGPSFPYRGVMVDTARNYFPIYKLKKIVDGMAASKLNVFHLHLSDAESFPLVLPSVKELSDYGAYSRDMVYTPEMIEDLRNYASIRGVRTIFEIDAPTHVNAGWNFDPNENLVICGDRINSRGHLNPDNDAALDVFEAIYGDLLKFSQDDEIFHIGGDEVDLNCWKTTETGRKYHDITELWADYTNQLLERLKIANNNVLPKNVVIWSSHLTDSNFLKKVNGNITVQFWLGSPRRVLESGHSIIYSVVGHWYLDCGFGAWRPEMSSGVCDPYTPWITFYKYRPWVEFGHQNQALGGEVCLWSEQVEVDDLENRIWPRAAAFAERVWSDPDNVNNYDVYTRFVAHRERLVGRGIKAAGVWPRWCSQNPGKCGF